MLRLVSILILLIALAGSDAAAQERARTSVYGPPAARASRVIEPAGYAESLADEGPAAAAEPPSQAKESPRSPLPLAPRDKSTRKVIARPSSNNLPGGLTTVISSLGIVLGLFVVLVWFSRRFAPAGTAALPKEAVELLGRTSLSGNQQMQLVRVGTKLLLVALSPQGPRTLTEITSATEVERLTEMCRRQKPDSSSASFRTLVEQIGSERTSSTFVDTSRRAPAAASATSRTRAVARS